MGIRFFEGVEWLYVLFFRVAGKEVSERLLTCDDSGAKKASLHSA
jgi:hypothetical protein